jgi:hypothetical protein
MREFKLPRNISRISEYKPYGRFQKIMLAVLCSALLFPGLLLIIGGILTKDYAAVLSITGMVFAGPGIFIVYLIHRDKMLTAAKQRDEQTRRGLEEQAGREEENAKKGMKNQKKRRGLNMSGYYRMKNKK